MVNLELNFNQRMHLSGALSQQKGSLGQTAIFLRLLDKVRLTDTESLQVAITPAADGTLSIKYPTIADFGELVTDIETADGTALLEMMTSWPHFTTADHKWADPIVKQLRDQLEKK